MSNIQLLLINLNEIVHNYNLSTNYLNQMEKDLEQLKQKKPFTLLEKISNEINVLSMKEEIYTKKEEHYILLQTLNAQLKKMNGNSYFTERNIILSIEELLKRLPPPDMSTNYNYNFPIKD
jgi:hypothetical protein